MGDYPRQVGISICAPEEGAAEQLAELREPREPGWLLRA